MSLEEAWFGVGEVRSISDLGCFDGVLTEQGHGLMQMSGEKGSGWRRKVWNAACIRKPDMPSLLVSAWLLLAP